MVAALRVILWARDHGIVLMAWQKAAMIQAIARPGTVLLLPGGRRAGRSTVRYLIQKADRAYR